jgi:hypothetical protein
MGRAATVSELLSANTDCSASWLRSPGLFRLADTPRRSVRRRKGGELLGSRRVLLGSRERLNRGSRELFTTREEAEAIVQAWDRDEPDQAGMLRVEKIEFETSLN